MNSKFEKIPYSENALKLQLVNTTVSCHDLTCGCSQPLIHLHQILTEEINKNQQCLTSGTAADHGEDVIDAGDLETLFAEELTEEG